MRLKYWLGNNFGDALNPIIFNKFLPDFFDNDPAADFFGIGSIIGFPMVRSAKKKIIFSSGFAYNTVPAVDNSYDIICVRGPETAKVLGISNKLAVTDGAALLREFEFGNHVKKYDFSFMPHWESEENYCWNKICMEAGIHYISPLNEPFKIIEDILCSKIVIAEAMHFAIVADTLRVPWIPVKAYPIINDFKWRDWTKSLDINYDPIQINSLYTEHEKYRTFINWKTKNLLPTLVSTALAKAQLRYQEHFLKPATVNQLINLKQQAPYLSTDYILNEKVDTLLEKLHFFKAKYSV